MFQHTAARRRLIPLSLNFEDDVAVSTHSRPKAAAAVQEMAFYVTLVSTHSRPKAADIANYADKFKTKVSTHSRPKAAGLSSLVGTDLIDVSTHSRPKAAGHDNKAYRFQPSFQHTAARRRLGSSGRAWTQCRCFNTQPPEGGWLSCKNTLSSLQFQHTAARRRLQKSK